MVTAIFIAVAAFLVCFIFVVLTLQDIANEARLIRIGLAGLARGEKQQ